MPKGRSLPQLFRKWASNVFGGRRERSGTKNVTQQHPVKNDHRNSTRRQTNSRKCGTKQSSENLRVDPNFLVISSIIARVFGVEHAVVHLYHAKWRSSRSLLCSDDESVVSSGTTDLPDNFLLDLAREASGIIFVPDCQDDVRFRSSPLVGEPMNIRYYVGLPLFVDDVKVGVLSLMDSEPREGSCLGHADRLLLTDFGALISESISRSNDAGMSCVEQSKIMVRKIPEQQHPHRYVLISHLS
jgi:transcriptional regulator with GAF, ATPase, and Fis domain